MYWFPCIFFNYLRVLCARLSFVEMMEYAVETLCKDKEAPDSSADEIRRGDCVAKLLVNPGEWSPDPIQFPKFSGHPVGHVPSYSLPLPHLILLPSTPFYLWSLGFPQYSLCWGWLVWGASSEWNLCTTPPCPTNLQFQLWGPWSPTREPAPELRRSGVVGGHLGRWSQGMDSRPPTIF